MTPLKGGAVRPLVQSPADELNGVLSGDGRWLAYESDESGRFEIYLRPFTGDTSARWLVSSGGGIRPAWVGDGHELVYLAADGFLMSVTITTANGSLQRSTPVRLFDTSPYYTGTVVTRTFDLSPDGTKFLMLKVKNADPDADIVVVRDWTTELARLLPQSR